MADIKQQRKYLRTVKAAISGISKAKRLPDEIYCNIVLTQYLGVAQKYG